MKLWVLFRTAPGCMRRRASSSAQQMTGAPIGVLSAWTTRMTPSARGARYELSAYISIGAPSTRITSNSRRRTPRSWSNAFPRTCRAAARAAARRHEVEVRDLGRMVEAGAGRVVRQRLAEARSIHAAEDPREPRRPEVRVDQGDSARPEPWSSRGERSSSSHPRRGARTPAASAGGCAAPWSRRCSSAAGGTLRSSSGTRRRRTGRDTRCRSHCGSRSYSSRVRRYRCRWSRENAEPNRNRFRPAGDGSIVGSTGAAPGAVSIGAWPSAACSALARRSASARLSAS